MLISYKRGQKSVILRVKILNSSVSTGAGLTGLTYSSSGLIISTIADNESAKTAYTVAGSTIEDITTLGTYAAPTATKCRFKKVDDTYHPGIYEIQIADARFAVSSAKFLIVSISGATNAAETDVVIPLQDLDPYDSVRANLSALPNVSSGSAGAVITSGTGTAQLSVTSGVASANVTQFGGSAGTFASGRPEVNTTYWYGQAVPATSVTGVPKVDIAYTEGVASHVADGTLASATSTTVTFPTTDSSSNAIPDDTRYEYVDIAIVAGTGNGQVIRLTTKSGVRTYGVSSGTMPVQCDSTSKYIVIGTWRAAATLAAGDVTGNLPVDLQTIKTQTVTCAGGVTVPAETLASTTNITAGTITTATNLTNAPTSGDFTSTMKTSIGTAVAASAVASVTGNVGGNVTGSVGSVTARVTANTDQLAGQTVTAAAGVTFPTSVASPTNITSASGINLNLGQTLNAARALDSIADTSLTVNDWAHCSIASAAGKETVSGSSYTVMTPFTGTVIRSFTLTLSTPPTTVPTARA